MKAVWLIWCVLKANICIGVILLTTSWWRLIFPFLLLFFILEHNFSPNNTSYIWTSYRHLRGVWGVSSRKASHAGHVFSHLWAVRATSSLPALTWRSCQPVSEKSLGRFGTGQAWQVFRPTELSQPFQRFRALTLALGWRPQRAHDRLAEILEMGRKWTEVQ